MRPATPGLLLRHVACQGTAGQGRSVRTDIPGGGRRAAALCHTIRLLPLHEELLLRIHHAHVRRRDVARLLPQGRRLLLCHFRQDGPEADRRDIHQGLVGTEGTEQLQEALPLPGHVQPGVPEHGDRRQEHARLPEEYELQDTVAAQPGRQGQPVQHTEGQRELRLGEL